MDNVQTTMQPQTTFPALLFTDARGEVIFANDNFREMRRRAERSFLDGEPLHSVLGIHQLSARRLMQEVRENGYAHQQPLELRSTSGLITPVWGSSAAAYDDREAFIGADFSLHDITHVNLFEAELMTHADVLATHMRHALDSARVQKDKTYIQAYFTSQLDALQVLLARMGGPRMRATLEAILNDVARRGGLPISMTEGQVKFAEESVTKSNAYGILMGEMATYAVNVVGQRMVARELQIIDERIDAKTLEVASRLGMRPLSGS